MRLIRPGFFAGFIYPEAIFRIDTSEKMLCLTFDDGPDPDSTPELLTLLDAYNIKCIFFCNGSAAERWPSLMKSIISAGHIIGNHGYSHMDGWKTSVKSYLEDIERAEPLTSGTLFRPPFGRMRISQYLDLKKRYRIMMWDVMAYDFDSRLGGEKSLEILEKNIRPGSVIVLHDTAGSAANKILEEFILYARGEGFTFALCVTSN
jgi:peptidoglycan-N-acetylglucosamine deacetylase